MKQLMFILAENEWATRTPKSRMSDKSLCDWVCKITSGRFPNLLRARVHLLSMKSVAPSNVAGQASAVRRLLNTVNMAPRFIISFATPASTAHTKTHKIVMTTCLQWQDRLFSSQSTVDVISKVNSAVQN